MIPATSIAFQDDGTALWFVPSDQVAASTALLDRPCDTCKGTGLQAPHWANPQGVCRSCSGNGRHTFTITTYCEQACDVWPCRWANDQGFNPQCNAGVRSLRVSVVPGMILPIYRPYEGAGTDRIWLTDGGHATMMSGRVYKTWDLTDIDPFPSDAKPGGFAVQLRVAS